MDYKNYYFDNFEELKSAKPNIAKKLLEEVGEGEWMTDGITLYPSFEDFAIYEVTEGYYNAIGAFAGDYRGAPDLTNYINFESLGEDLVSYGDWSVVIGIDGCVLSTGFGW